MRGIRVLIAFLAVALSQASASVPITCSQLKAFGHKFIYFGFTGTSTNAFAMGYSDDMVRLYSMSATYPSCNNGASSPCPVNSPSATMYTDSTTNACHIYTLIAEANDAGYNSSKQDIGVLEWDGTNYSSLFVQNLLTFDWGTALGVGSGTIFAGRWDVVPNGNNCFTTPVTTTTGYYNWTAYRACANLTPTSASITSGPTAVTISGATNGFYDTQVIANPPTQSSSCVIVGTQTASGLPYRLAGIAAGTCGGSYTFICNANSATCPLYLQNATGSMHNEGPNFLQPDVPNNWRFYDEQITSHQLYSFSCVPGDLQSCQLSLPVAMVTIGFPASPRAGTFLWMGNPPVKSMTIISGNAKLRGSGKVR